MNRKPLGAGVIGLGVGEQHARAFAVHPECRLVALCDRDEAKLREVSARVPAPKLCRDANELIDDPEVAIVVVASNDDDHCGQIVRALRAGKHVFSEKPLCLSRAELDSIREAWRRSGCRLSTNTILRYSPRFRWLRDAIGAGEFGTVYSIEADYVYGRLHKLISGWRGAIPGYSVMLGGGIHMVDLVTWIAGRFPVEAAAFGSGLASRGSGFSGNDLSIALLKFENGLVARVGANFASVHPHFHRIFVYGTAATFENTPQFPTGPARLWKSRLPEDPPQLVEAAYPGVGKGEMIPAFVDAVFGRGEPAVTEAETFAAISICLAIEQSIAEDRIVKINYN